MRIAVVVLVIAGGPVLAAPAVRPVPRPSARAHDLDRMRLADGELDYRALADHIYLAKARGQRHRAGPDFAIPRLRAVESLVKKDRAEKPFAGYQIYGLQHILPSTESLLALFEDAGAAPHMELEGKIYSESPLVVEEMQARGRHIGDRPDGKNAHPDTTVSSERLVAKLLAQARREPQRKFLIIDDGADLIEAVDAAVRQHPELASRVVGVQQTRHGTDRLRTHQPRFPVVDIGDSWAKREFEGPSIGRSVALRIDARLQRTPHRTVLIVGYGAVGRHSALVLRKLGYEVHMHDPDPARQALAREDGIKVYRRLNEALRAHHVIVGATGRVFLDSPNAHLLPKGALLFNAASNDTEFESYAVTHAGAELQNNGAPINFGDLSPVPARYIQLTRGLLYFAARQAIATRASGVSSLDEHVQQQLVNAVQSELAETHESLLDPSFSVNEL